MNRSNSNKASPINSKRGQTPIQQHSGGLGSGGGGATVCNLLITINLAS
jgi:hypothetical protein